MQPEETSVYDTQAIESKWVKHWDDTAIYSVQIDPSKPKFYCLDTFIYPSADGAHVGHVKSFAGMDVMARYKRMKGFNVLYPGGWDTLGLPAENYAIKSGKHPREITDTAIENFRQQFRAFGLSYDWKREINTADPSYYRWTQWLFLVMYENGLAYKKQSAVNWCPVDQTVLAKEQVEDGKCERCGAEVTQRDLMQWFFKVSDYAERLDADLDKLDWEEKYLKVHKNWIGKKVTNGKTSYHVRDWCVSRQRYWGPPIPIIYCDDCGIVPVPKEDLPVHIPEVVDFTPTGKSPLASNPDFVHTTCPNCGKQARRETDTLDTFVSSAWYQFRFEDPWATTDFASKEALEYWQAVDHYEGTVEHLTAHLVYARFVTKVLFDQGYCPVDEPFPKYTPVGVLVDKDGSKFSKRLGNAPNTNELIETYGGDLIRMSCQFISPFSDVSRWGIDDVIGVGKFRNKVWRIFSQQIVNQTEAKTEETSETMHVLTKDVSENIEAMKYNIALSKLMSYIGDVSKQEATISWAEWRVFTQLIAPFAPFIAEEMWSQMGNEQSVHISSWPEYDPAMAQAQVVEIAIQRQGKTKSTIRVPINSSQEEVVELIKQSSFAEFVPASYSTYYVPNKVINFVVEEKS